MDMTTSRKMYRPDGIFSEVVRDDTGEVLMRTLEHAYQDEGTQAWAPKIPPGTYTCVRGTHELKNGVPFTTYEVTGVEGHSGILFHKGNWDKDSEGCILCGLEFADSSRGKMVTQSAVAFDKFMELQAGVDLFYLKVVA